MKTLLNRLQSIPTRLSTLTLLCLAAAMAGTANAQSTWKGGGADQNWSTAGNWTGGAPGTSSTVTFPDGPFPISTNSQGVVNSIVQSSTTISSLTFNNQNNNFQTVQIPTGASLTVSGNLSVGASDPAGSNTVVTITGGGSLFAGTNGTSTLTGQNGNGNNPVSVLDLSGLANFSFNASASSPGAINLGNGSSGSGITVSLAANSNYLAASTLNLANNNTRGNVILNLGNGTNIIFADTINMGVSKTVGTMQFRNNAGGGLKIASHTGTGRTTFVVSGEGSSGTTGANNNGFLLFNGGTVNILASTMTLGNRTTRGGGGTATGILSFDNGVVDVTTLSLALNGGGGDTVTGLVSVATSGVLKIGTGGLSLVNETGIAGSGTLSATGGGTVTCAGNIFKTTSTGVGTLTLDSGNLTMSSTTGTIGASTGIPIDYLNITNSTLTLPVAASPNVLVVNLSPDFTTTSNVINVSSMPTINSFPAQFPIISYQVPSGNLDSFALGTLPGLPGTFSGYVSNNVNNLSIDLVVTNGPVAKADEWSGTINNQWDTTTLNWINSGMATNYNDLDQVTFDDFAISTNINLAATRVPASLTVNNNVLNFNFTGAGKISGPVGLAKFGAGSLTLAETGGDNFSGGITVNAGTLVLDNANSAISGGLSIFGSTVQIGNNDAVGTLPSGTLDNEGTLVFNRTDSITVGTVIPGGGALVQSGSGRLALSGVNTYSGATTVNSGTLALTNSGAIASSASVTVNSNATLDVSGVTTSAGLQGLNLSNATVNVKVGYLQTNFTATSVTLAGSTNFINVRSLPPIAFYPTTNVLIQSSSPISGNNLGLGSLPSASPAYVGTNILSADQTSVLLVLTAGPIGTRPTVNWSGVDALGGISTNWSDAQNWQTPGIPVAGEKVAFNDTAVAFGSPFDLPGDGNGGIVNPANIDNIVDINATNAGVTYANTVFHNTLVNPGKTLTVNGSLTVNGGGTATILGTNGTLTINNPGNSTVLNVDNSTAPTLDMSGLDTLTGTINQVGVGFNSGSSGSAVSGVWYMARTNVITTGSGFSGIGAALILGSANSQNAAGTGTVYLGQTNALSVDGIAMGAGPSVGNVITFNPAVSNNHPALVIRGITGSSSRVTQWSLGDNTVNLNNHSPGSGHINDFSAGTLDALVSTLNVGQGSQCNTAPGVGLFTGLFNMGAGNLDVTTLRIGLSGGGSSGGGIGIMNVTGGTVVANTLALAATGGGQALTSGTLNLTNANLVASTGIAIGAGTAGGTLSLINSTAKILSGTIGSPTSPLTTLNLDGATLQLTADAGVTGASVVCSNIVAANMTTLNIASATNVSGTAQIPLISYAAGVADPYPNLTLGTTPAGYTIGNGGLLVDNTANLSIDIILTSTAAPSTNANILSVTLSNGNIILHGTNNNGGQNFQYAVLTSTNLALPLSSWTVLSTNPFKADGTFDYTNAVTPSQPRQFFDVQVVQ